MYQARLKGTYYEMGYQQGIMMKNGAVPPIWLNSLNDTVNPERIKFADECEEIVRRHTPDFLEELQGISDAVNVDYSKVRIWPLCFYAKLQQSCSAVAISGNHTMQGRPIFIRNYDYLDSDGKDFTALWTKPKNGYASLGFSDAMSSRYCGFNEKGLALAANTSGYAGSTQPGIVFGLATRWVLDKHSTTDEAVEFFKTIPHFHGWNFLICDMHSNIVRVETCPEKVEVIRYDEGIGVSTNHYLSEKMQGFEEKNWLSYGSTVRRHDNALKWFQSRNELITVHHAQELAKNRVDEGGLCDRFKGIEGGTLWSWIHVLGDQDVLISDGPPCRHAYQKTRAF